VTVPIHESGNFKRTHGGRKGRFRGGGGRPVFGLWATYRIAASRLVQDSALACAVQSFVPITAAGQRRSYTGFPFNKALRGFDLHMINVHGE
jgi:hypothetical protein